MQLLNVWLAEAIRLQEIRSGQLADHDEVIKAIETRSGLKSRIIERARLLSEREGIYATVRQWNKASRVGLFILFALSIIAGSSSAYAALGSGSNSVNVFAALLTLLGLNLLMMFIWLVSLFTKAPETITGLGRLWFWVSRRLSSSSNTNMVLQALLGVISRQRASRPLFAVISHAFWLCLLTAALISLIALLSTKRYSFHWETTLLSADTFIFITQALGWLPTQIGFNVPDAATVISSGGLGSGSLTMQALWSGWLIGCILIYGIIPRVIALIIMGILLNRRLHHSNLDTGMPGFAQLRSRLSTDSATGKIDSKAPPYSVGITDLTAYKPSKFNNTNAIVGIELPYDYQWPPEHLGSQVSDLGVIDSRDDRNLAISNISAILPTRLLIVCDASQTPDRGSLRLIHQLSIYSENTKVLLVNSETSLANNMTTTWVDGLNELEQSRYKIYTDAKMAVSWLIDQLDVTSKPSESSQ